MALPTTRSGRAVTSFEIMNKIRNENSIDVWVFNVSSLKQEPGKPKKVPTVIMFVVQTGNQNPAVLRIPKTWVPINIGLQVSKNHLFEDSNFLNAITRGLLRPITSNEAHEFFAENPEATDEYDVAIASLDRGTQELEATEMADFSTLKEQGGDAPTDISMSVLNVVSRFNAPESDLDANQAFQLITNMSRELTEKDKAYIINSISDQRIQAYINKLK